MVVVSGNAYGGSQLQTFMTALFSRKTPLLLFVCLSAAVCLGAPPVQATPRRMFPLETFEEDAVLTFPAPWQVRGNQDEAQTMYRVMEEGGNRFLHAQATQQAIQIGLVHGFSPQEFPILR